MSIVFMRSILILFLNNFQNYNLIQLQNRTYFKMDSKQKLIGTIIFKDFKLTKQLGTGAFGQIYLACSKSKQQQKYAAKFQQLNAKHPQLYFEAKLYRLLNSDGMGLDRGIPKVHAMSTEGNYNIMLMDLLGASLEDLFKLNNNKFSVKTVVLIADQLLERIEFLHSKEFLHRDIKPDNFLIGRGKKVDKIYMIDLGLAKKYMKEGKHIPYKEGKQLTGTARYASVNTHMGIQQSRRDDIESIGYVLMYFLKGVLPWQNMKSKDTKTKYDMIKDKKISTPTEVLCHGYPAEFAIYLNYAKALKFDSKPDYQYLRGLFRKVREEKGFEDEKFDWNIGAEKQVVEKPITYIPQKEFQQEGNIKKIEEKYVKIKEVPVPESKYKKTQPQTQNMSVEKSEQSTKKPGMGLNFSLTGTKTKTMASTKPATIYEAPKVAPPRISRITK